MLKFYSSPADKNSEYYFIADLLARGYTVNFCRRCQLDRIQ